MAIVVFNFGFKH